MQSLGHPVFVPFACFIGPNCFAEFTSFTDMPFIAFILYRQHFQGQVIAQNPGLANPEISKIIGAQWRDQPPEVKDDWKRLAEV